MTSSPDLRRMFPLDQQLGPAARISRDRAAEMVERAMQRASEPVSERKPATRTARWRKIAFMAAAAIAVPATVVAGAVQLVFVHHRASAPMLAAVPKSEPIVEKARPPSPAEPRHAEPVEISALESTPAPRATRESSRAAAGARLGPQQLLQRANELRAKRQWLAATQIYEQTFHTYPNRAEAYSAMVAAGLLRLDHLGDAQGALGLLSAAIRLRPGGALSEEAEWGRIESLRALGQRSAEKGATDEFVRRHPQSLLAPRAGERLRELEEDAQ